MGSPFWKILYRRWRRDTLSQAPGMTILVPVPGELPVFLDLALRICARQEAPSVREILIIPDQCPRAFGSRFESLAQDWRAAPLRMVTPSRADRVLAARLGNPHHNHWLQLIRGVEAARTDYLLLHDADCFLIDPDFFQGQYAHILEHDAVCLGLNDVWDAWYRETGFGHVVATWELVFRRDWARSFPPYLHRGHRNTLGGHRHDFDTLLLAQCLTAPKRIARSSRDWQFVHFNYVVCTYRWFLGNRGVFQDSSFRLLLIRLLMEACGYGHAEAATLPGLDEFHEALRGRSSRIAYDGAEPALQYAPFKAKLEMLLQSDVFDAAETARVRAALAPFDAVYPAPPAALQRECLSAAHRYEME